MKSMRGGGTLALLAAALLVMDPGLARAMQAGDTVAFGRYPQELLGEVEPADGVEGVDWVAAGEAYYAVEPIQWRVLEAGEDGLLLLSEAVLDVRPYQTPLPAVAWRDCTLRRWLNDTAEGGFLGVAFTAEEMAALRPTDSGEGIAERAFCLSMEEADGYFAGEADRAAGNTAYAAAITGLHADYWWLRTPPGGVEGFAAYVCDRGMIFPGTHHVFYELGVRPALWVEESAVDAVP